MAAKIRKGDKVIVLAGRDKGRSGEVVEVRTDQGRALVRGINMVKRHQKQSAQQEGGIWPLPIPKTASRPALDSSSWAKATTDARCGLPDVREWRSMADNKHEAKPEAPEKAQKPARPQQPVGKGQQAQKADRSEKAGASGKGERTEKPAKPRPPEERVTPRLRTYFDGVVRENLSKEFGYRSRLQVPVIEKIVINMGIGEGVNDRKKVESAANDLGLIAGQKAVITKARKSIATFKVRDGQPIGCKVTLRKARMYEFVDRLINIALPRVRDFRGLSPKSFDGRGNYTIGIKEHIIFPEIDYDKAADIWGMDITVCTSAKTDDEARALLRAFNFPFRQ